MARRTMGAQSDGSIQGLSVDQRNDWIWVTLPDAVNMDNYQKIECRVETMLFEGCRIAIDLSRTRNIYSSGFGMIVRIKKMVDGRRGSMCLVNSSPKTLEAFEAVGLTRLMDVYSEGDSLEFMQNKQ